MPDFHTTPQVLSELKRMIADELDVNLSEDQIDENASFFEDGLGIDSIAIVEFISLIEDRFEVRFRDEDLVPQSFSNLNVLAKLVSVKLGH